MPKTDLVSIPSSCTLCPRRCGADRAAGRTGFCGAGNTLKAARAALHYWEEPCISGTRGSGTVFFSGCTLKCCFCQNYPISAEGLGKEITVEHLAEIFPGPAVSGRPQHQSGHAGAVAALDHRRVGHCARKGSAPAYPVQHRRLRDGGKRGSLARVHRHLAGRSEICLLCPVGRAFLCTGLLLRRQSPPLKP